MSKKEKSVEIHKTKRRFSAKLIALCTALVILVCGTIGVTVAWLISKDQPVVNTFSTSFVQCEVNKGQSADGILKGVTIKNTSDISAYIRIRLVSNYKDENGNILANKGQAKLPTVSQDNWIKIGEYYYCKTPVAAGSDTPVLIDDFKLENDQTVDVLAEAIQSEPTSAVSDAWNVEVSGNEITRAKGE